ERGVDAPARGESDARHQSRLVAYDRQFAGRCGYTAVRLARVYFQAIVRAHVHLRRCPVPGLAIEYVGELSRSRAVRRADPHVSLIGDVRVLLPADRQAIPAQPR